MDALRRMALVMAAASAGCQKSAPPAPNPAGPVEETIDGARVVEVFLHGATASSPLIVGLHGRGGSPEHFGRVFARYPGCVEVALVQGFLPSGLGYEWFDLSPGMSDDEAARVIAAAESRLWPILEKVARGRTMIVTGFSQGAFMTYALAARHPGAIAYAFPISGGIPAPLYPKGHAATAPVHAVHGVEDERVSIGWDRATRDGFVANGSVADLREFPGAVHQVSPEMLADLFPRFEQVAASIAGASPSGGATP
jgi:phospholipase/carboxylesterase